MVGRFAVEMQTRTRFLPIARKRFNNAEHGDIDVVGVPSRANGIIKNVLTIDERQESSLYQENGALGQYGLVECI